MPWIRRLLGRGVDATDNLGRSQEGEAPLSLAHMSYPALARGTQVIRMDNNSGRDAGWLVAVDGPTNCAYSVIRDGSPCFAGIGPDNIDGSSLTLPLQARAELLQREMKTMAGEMQDRVREQEQTVSTLQEEIGSLTRSLESEREAKRRLENELEKSRETCRRAKAEFVQSVAGAGRYFDFNSTFPSPSELTAEIDALSDGVFYDWLDIAFDTAKAWTPSHDLESVNYVVKQTLVLIVSQCHKTVQDVVNERMLLLKSFLACDPAIGRNQETPNYIRNLPANIFREAHKFIFRIFFPLPDGSFELLDDIIERVRTASELPDTEVLHYLLQSKSTSGVFRNLVLTLLQIFLECELSRPRPLRFDASFGGEEQWSSEKHSKRMIYPCEDGPGKFSSHDKVQVVLPPVYLAREDNETSRHRVNFETKAVVFSSATPNLTVNKGCHSGCTAVDTGEVRREMKSAMVDNIPPTIEPLTSRTS